MSGKRLALGVGCVHGATPQALQALVTTTLTQHDMTAADIALVASIDQRRDEIALRNLAAMLGAPLRFYTAAALLAETARLVHPSQAVFHAVGCYGVAEGAALAAAGPDATLVVAKQVGDHVTCALAGPAS